jgi:DNA-binding MarR family transcriptional regulator
VATHAAPAVDRAFAANVLGALARTITDRVDLGTAAVSGHGASTPAALSTLLFYPDRPITFLAMRLRISHPGAVQLSERLAAQGLVERPPGPDGRTRLLRLTSHGETAARRSLAARRDILDRALDALDDGQVAALTSAVDSMLHALTDTLLSGEFMCRACDELACPDELCPVERAEPAPPHRRGPGYGVPSRPSGRA